MIRDLIPHGPRTRTALRGKIKHADERAPRTSFSRQPRIDIMTLPSEIAAKAEEIVNSVTLTVYQHKDDIDPAAGIYKCDCNGFAEFVLENTAPGHLKLIPKEADQSRPRAFEYFSFFASLTPDSAKDWRRVDLLAEARRGDIVAWRFPTIEAHQDTGHVVILAEAPKLDPSGEFFTVRVYDLAAEAHFNDTRNPSSGPAPAGATGVGSGVLNFKVDAEGRPLAYLFAPPITAQYAYRPIAIGRAL